jgi:hypothetical protein
MSSFRTLIAFLAGGCIVAGLTAGYGDDKSPTPAAAHAAKASAGSTYQSALNPVHAGH